MTNPFLAHDTKMPLRERVGGPLDGLTFAVKDMFAVAGERCSGGSPAWLRDAPVADSHAPMVSSLLSEGAVLVGKTICDELFYSLAGSNAHYGTPTNTAWPGRLPGGSSSGSAAAVAASLCDFALGSDTAGSIRVPAAFCGVFGIRTTRGALNTLGVMTMAPSFDATGWFARSAATLAKIGDVLLSHLPLDEGPPLSVLVPEDLIELAGKDVGDVFADAMKCLPSWYPDLEPVEFYDGQRDRILELFRVAQGWEFGCVYGDWIRHRSPPFGPGIRERVDFALSIGDAQGRRASSEIEEISIRLRAKFGPRTIAICPTTPSTPPLLDATADELNVFRDATLAMTVPASIGGLPQVAIPIQAEAGPLSISLLGAPQTDRALLRRALGLAMNVDDNTRVRSIGGRGGN